MGRKRLQAKDQHYGSGDRWHMVARVAIVSRLAVCSLMMVTALITDDYDTSSDVQGVSTSRFDGFLRTIFGGFAKWDAIYNLRIAQSGYEFEQYHGFFPGFPLTIWAVSKLFLWPIASITLPDTRLLIAGVIVANTSFVLAAIFFYYLGRHVLQDESQACVAALLFCINPASVFFSAVYTESFFAFTSFAGMFYASISQLELSALFFGLACSIRGNGLVNIGFIIYASMVQAVEIMNEKHQGFSFNYINNLFRILIRLILSVSIVILPWAAFQAYGYWQYCTDPNSLSERRPWCDDKIPLLYSFVQREYWHNGLFAYYQIKQIPNFIIALPNTVLCILAIVYYFRDISAHVVYTLGLPFQPIQNTSSTSKKSGFSYSSHRLFVYIVHLSFLTLFGVTCMYIQCTVRFICASSPVIFWFVAQKPVRIPLMTVYSLAYTAIGVVLFSNFYPWT